MGVFSKYKPTQARDVFHQAHPAVYSYPWIPSQTRVRQAPNTANQGTSVQRIQPHEVAATFNRSLPQAQSNQQSKCSSHKCAGCKGCGQ